ALAARRTGGMAAAEPTEAPELLRGGPAQIKTDRCPDFRGCGDRPSTRNSADHGQYSGAVPNQADRARCCRCRVLNDQISGRAWKLDRRSDCRWREPRLGRSSPKSAGFEYALSPLSTRRLDRSG